MGQDSKAEPLYIQALAVRKEVLGEKHADYAQTLNNLAELYRKRGELKKAEPLVKALAVRKTARGETSRLCQKCEQPGIAVYGLRQLFKG